MTIKIGSTHVRGLILMLGLCLLGAGCSKGYSLLPTDTTDHFGSIPACRYYQKVATYSGDAKEVAIKTVLPILQQVDPAITAQDLRVESPAYLNFTTNPPTPSTGEVVFDVIDTQGGVKQENHSVESAVKVELGIDYLNSSSTIREKLCSRSRPVDCLSGHTLTDGEVFKVIPNPC